MDLLGIKNLWFNILFYLKFIIINHFIFVSDCTRLQSVQQHLIMKNVLPNTFTSTLDSALNSLQNIQTDKTENSQVVWDNTYWE